VEHPPAEVLIVDDDDDGIRFAAVTGVLDVFSASRLASRILGKLPSGVRSLVVDLEGTEGVDSGGLSALVRLGERARARALDVHVRLGDATGLNTTVKAILGRVFDTSDDQPSVGSPAATHG
jgi:anti-anti-sigma regulatory factor